jgi:3-oxoacyl-[acyl-carrier-protein] synthase II
LANCEIGWINNTKSFIGHAMGAAGALELAGNLPSFAMGLPRDDQRRRA